MKPNHDPAVVAHVATLAEKFATTPTTVRRWIAKFGMSPMPSAFVVAVEIERHSRGRRRATLDASRREASKGKEPWKEGFREALKRS